jgi:hypothetical protein
MSQIKEALRAPILPEYEALSVTCPFLRPICHEVRIVAATDFSAPVENARYPCIEVIHIEVDGIDSHQGGFAFDRSL